MITGHWCKPTLNVDIIYKQCYVILLLLFKFDAAFNQITMPRALND